MKIQPAVIGCAVSSGTVAYSSDPYGVQEEISLKYFNKM
jgi:hypothetical protein